MVAEQATKTVTYTPQRALVLSRVPHPFRRIGWGTDLVLTAWGTVFERSWSPPTPWRSWRGNHDNHLGHVNIAALRLVMPTPVRPVRKEGPGHCGSAPANARGSRHNLRNRSNDGMYIDMAQLAHPLSNKPRCGADSRCRSRHSGPSNPGRKCNARRRGVPLVAPATDSFRHYEPPDLLVLANT